MVCHRANAVQPLCVYTTLFSSSGHFVVVLLSFGEFMSRNPREKKIQAKAIQ